jgi:hypothetical protein
LADFYVQLPSVTVSDVTLSGPITVTNEVEVKNDAGSPIPVDAVNFDIRDLNFAQDKVDVSGSTVITTQPAALNFFNEISSVPSGVYTTVLTKTVTVAAKLKLASCSSNNIAEYEVVLNGIVIDKKRTNFGAGLNCDFYFENGITLVPTDVLVVRARHDRPYMADINAKLIIER